MAGTVNATLYYQENSYAGVLTARTEVVSESGQYLEVTKKVSGVCLTLFSPSTMKAVSINTNASGAVQVTNVPDGEYLLMETAGTSPQFITGAAVDFSKGRTVTVTPVTQDPSVSVINALGYSTYDATEIVSLTQNTYRFTVSSAQTTCSHIFIDAPRKSVPIVFRDCIITGDNLIKSVDSGSFGTLPQASSAGTSSTSCPYNPYTTGEYTSTVYDSRIYSNYIKYSGTAPDGGYYSICNIANLHTFSNRWFDTPGKKQGDETGRFLIVNGKNPGNYFFKEKVRVKTGVDYLFSAWIMNIYRLYTGVLPLFKVMVQTTSGTTLFSKNTAEEFPLYVTTIPTWRQIGAIIPAETIGSNTELVISFVSMGNEVLGNDYCVDEISLYELEETALTPVLSKTADKAIALENEDITYTLSLSNQTSSYIYDLILNDVLQDGVTLSYYSLQIKVSTLNATELLPSTGLRDFPVSERIATIMKNMREEYKNDPYYSFLSKGIIPRGLPLTLIFRCRVKDASKLSASKAVGNFASLRYKSPLDGENPMSRNLLSNTVATAILYPILKSTKEVARITEEGEVILQNGETAFCGETVAYRIVIQNTGGAPVSNLQITDCLDSTHLLPIYSLSENCNGGISMQIKGNEEVFLPCSSIQKIEGSVYNITITGISVPVGTGEAPGECTVRIYCRIIC